MELEQQMHYEWCPWQCLMCKFFGHMEGECLKNKKVTKKWVRKDSKCHEAEKAVEPSWGQTEQIIDAKLVSESTATGNVNANGAQVELLSKLITPATTPEQGSW